MSAHELYMQRCIQLALQAGGYAAPNPLVGSVLVHQDRIIGEGWHQQYGGPHAEVNCIRSVKEEDRYLVPLATLYVSLEPCAHFGKTPPCADLIVEQGIRKVVVGSRDPFVQVNGKGIEKLRAAGVEVTTGILEAECLELNKRFFCFHNQHRPYVVLKWAQTADRRIANEDYSRVLISNAWSNRLVHRWRSEEMGIVVGTNTALFDDPALTTRLWPGRQPVRIVVDTELRLPSSLKLFDGSQPTIVFNYHKHTIGEALPEGTGYYQVTHDVSLVQQMLHGLYQLNVQSVLVEGGAQLLQTFIDEEAWDEARIITNEGMHLGAGLPAPQLRDALLTGGEQLRGDSIGYWKPQPKQNHESL